VIVNQQRRIAGISFPQLLEMIDTSDKESRQELVRQAAISVFAHGSSGFLHKGGNEFSALASVVSETFNKSRD
jgi:mannose/fructose-specific phosphotransferase system component IIA